MKIILTVTNDLTYDQRMYRICSALSEAGYTVELVGRSLPNSIPLKDRPYAQKRLRCLFHKGKAFYAEYNIRLFFYLFFTPVDVICSIDLDTLLPGFLVSRWRRKKMVYDAHEYFTEVPEVIERPAVQRFWERIAQYSIPRIPNAYTVNGSLAKIFEEKYKTHFEVIYNAPHFELVPVPDNFSKRILLYQGALNAARGLEQLINAMPGIDATLWLVGEGDLSDMLRKQVKELGIDDKVIFKGMIPPENLAEITRQATIGINVSRNAGESYYYSLNNKCFDYMHAQLPSVTNDFPEYRAINNAFEIMVLTQCEESLLKNDINALLNNSLHYSILKQNCLLASQYYSWETEKGKLIQFYAQLH